jgi:hypothetical protein
VQLVAPWRATFPVAAGLRALFTWWRCLLLRAALDACGACLVAPPCPAPRPPGWRRVAAQGEQPGRRWQQQQQPLQSVPSGTVSSPGSTASCTSGSWIGFGPGVYSAAASSPWALHWLVGVKGPATGAHARLARQPAVAELAPGGWAVRQTPSGRLGSTAPPEGRQCRPSPAKRLAPPSLPSRPVPGPRVHNSTAWCHACIIPAHPLVWAAPQSPVQICSWELGWASRAGLWRPGVSSFHPC